VNYLIIAPVWRAVTGKISSDALQPTAPSRGKLLMLAIVSGLTVTLLVPASVMFDETSRKARYGWAVEPGTELNYQVFESDAEVVDRQVPFDVREPGNALSIAGVYTLAQPYTAVAQMAETDKDLRAGLEARGFRTSLGDDDAGLIWLMWIRAGGFYLDVGASTMIVNGQIKVKSGPILQGFDETGALFDDGSKVEADVVVIATGYEKIRETVKKLCAPEICEKLKPVWGLDEEYELNSVWRDCGIDKMWILFGNIAASRYHSSFVALQIKAMKEGIFNGERYSL